MERLFYVILCMLVMAQRVCVVRGWWSVGSFSDLVDGDEC